MQRAVPDNEAAGQEWATGQVGDNYGRLTGKTFLAGMSV